MISAHTPPGTRVVCIDDDQFACCVPGWNYVGTLDGLKKDVVYTIAEIVPAASLKSGFAAVLHEIVRPRVYLGFNRGFDIARFRYADLPSCLTELLKPVHIPREELV